MTAYRCRLHTAKTEYGSGCDISLLHSISFLAVSDALLPIRIVASIALVAVIIAFIYVLSHLKKIEQTIVSDNLVPPRRGPRNNVVLIICAIPIIVITLLLFLVLKA
jgi:hypothetical protein